MKNLLLSLGLVLTLLGCAAPSENLQTQYNKRYRAYHDIPLGEHYTGRSPYMSPKPGDTPPPPEEPAPPPVHEDCGTSSDGLIHIGKRMPAEVAYGDEFMYEIDTRVLACAGNIVVTDVVPEGASYVRSEPAAQVDGRNLTWRLPDMDAGQSQTIKVWLKAEKEGTLTSCALAHAWPRACGSTRVGRAMIALQKTGPETAELGSDVTYNILVSNRGTSVARSVVVTDELPEGLTHPDGRRLTFNVGDLPPGESRSIPVTVKAAQRGKHCNVASVATANAGSAEAEACTTVLQPGLKIVKTGDEQQFLSRTAKYRIVISNTGDTTLTGVVVTDTAPQYTAIATAPGASISGNTATWNVGSLAPGEEKAFDLTLSASAAGNHCNSATVATAQGLRETAQACTVWQGVSALLLEKADNPDPIQIGENTTYTVKVTNQGTADDTNIKVVVQFPPEIDPVSASNGGVINGKTVTFPAFPRLQPKQAFEYSVVGKGVKEGDCRVTFIRTSDDIPAPTTAEESTRVY